MPSRKRYLWIVFLLAFALTGLDRPAGAVGIGDLDKINQLIEETKEKLTQKKKEEKSVLTSLTRAQKDLSRIETDLDYINARLKNTERSIAGLETELTKIDRSLKDLQTQKRARLGKMNDRLVAVYKYGMTGYFEMLCSAESLADLVSKFETVSYFLRHDVAAIAKVEEVAAEIKEQQREYEDKKASLQSERNRYAALQKDAQNKQKQKTVLIGNTREELEKINNDMDKLEAALDELERTSKEIEAQIRKKQNEGAVLGTGKMIWPVQGRISSQFGWRMHPILKKRKFHSGIDLAVPSGTSVKAADTGKVIISGWNGGYGNFITIDHGNGISTSYAHNSRLLVKEGEMVLKGQEIAKSGNTGLSTGPHLHFEVRINGAPVDPITYLPK